MDQEIRTFVAIELPDPLRASLRALQDRLGAQISPRSVRWVQPRGIHLTLKFLGQTSGNLIDAIAGALHSACADIAPFTYSVGGLGCFPDPRRPRVIWVGVQERTGTLGRLQRAVDDACAQFGFERERRAFHPHLTLGRLRDRRTSARERRAIGELIEESEVTSLATVMATGVSFIRSDLRPDGAVYTTLEEIALRKG